MPTFPCGSIWTGSPDTHIEFGPALSYPICKTATTQFGPTVLLTLQTEENINIKIYLPRRYAEGFDDQDIEYINEGKKYIN